MNTRRSFLHKVGALSLTSVFASLAQPAWSRNLETALWKTKHISAEDLAADEDFWYYIQQSFTSSTILTNLNNGAVSPAPRVVQEAMKRYYDQCNEAPGYYLTQVLDLGKEPLRKNLARLAGCSPEEIVINRNSTEGLETVIFGLSLKAGDEVVAAKQDYPSMINAYKQREQRDGIKTVWLNLEMPKEDENYFINQYVNAFTSKTKVVHITHMINWNGQILPVKKIAKEAHKRGIEVIVDGAHTFAQFDFTIPDLDADYFATSLHKWLFAPIGTGMLYVKKEKIGTIYPLFAASDDQKDNIRKFEHLGTRPFYIEQAISKAIDFHEMIGIERKQKRLHYLKNYWMEKIKDVKGIKVNTSLDPKWGCAIGNIGMDGKSAKDFEVFLYNNYRLHTVSIDKENIHGIRVTPNVYTTLKELDLLVEGINAFAKA